jgi:hypothetical protein
MHDKQGVRVLRHAIKHRSKLRQLHLERVKLLPRVWARLLHGFDQLAYALLPESSSDSSCAWGHPGERRWR